MKRLLGVVRLSRLTDETTSPEGQREQIIYTAKARRDKLINPIVEDLDVSGGVSVWGRDLAPWLTRPDLVSSWDSLIVAKLDRLTRSLLDFQRLLAWCQENSKSIISVSEGFDLSTPVGRLIANILVMFAEFERERMGERRAEAAVRLRSGGYWNGGRIPYGKQAVKAGEHWKLEADPKRRLIVERMAEEILHGKSASQLAREFNAERVPSAVGGKWFSTTILNILRSSDNVLDSRTWAKVQIAIERTSKSKAQGRYDATALLGIAYCGVCSEKLRGNSKIYYRCYKCGARQIRQEKLEAVVDEAILAYGWVPVTEPVLILETDASRKLTQVGKSMAALTQELSLDRITDDTFGTRMMELRAERARLKAEIEEIDSQPPEQRRVPTGQTIQSAWPAMDKQAKRLFMLERKIKAYAVADDPYPVVTLDRGDLIEDIIAFAELQP